MNDPAVRAGWSGFVRDSLMFSYLRFRLAAMVLAGAFLSQWATAQTAVAGSQRIVQETWAFKDGAPVSPTSLAQTADGYLWVGDSAGLLRFDGSRFELFRAASGEPLQPTFVSALSAADDGLWVGYWFGGFSFIERGRVRNFVDTTGTVTGFAPDKQGVVWAGSQNRKENASVQPGVDVTGPSAGHRVAQARQEQDCAASSYWSRRCRRQA